MAQKIPSLNDLYDEHHDLTEDIGPLSHYWMFVKYIVIYPGVEIDNYKVIPCKIGEDGAVYIVKEAKQVAQFSTKAWSLELFGFISLMKYISKALRIVSHTR